MKWVWCENGGELREERGRGKRQKTEEEEKINKINKKGTTCFFLFFF